MWDLAEDPVSIALLESFYNSGKILVWEDADKKTWVSYNSSTYLQERHNVPTELLQNIAVVETLAAKAAE